MICKYLDVKRGIKAVNLEHKLLMNKNRKLEKEIESLDTKNGFILTELTLKKSKEKESKLRYDRLVANNKRNLKKYKYEMQKQLKWQKNRVLGID